MVGTRGRSRPGEFTDGDRWLVNRVWGSAGPSGRASGGPSSVGLLVGAVLRRPALAGQVAGGVDEAHVAHRLGEVPEEPARGGIVLLGQEPDVVAEREQPLEDLGRLADAALEREVVGQPERAREE